MPDRVDLPCGPAAEAVAAEPITKRGGVIMPAARALLQALTVHRSVLMLRLVRSSFWLPEGGRADFEVGREGTSAATLCRPARDEATS
jgi:hypothetical protein